MSRQLKNYLSSCHGRYFTDQRGGVYKCLQTHREWLRHSRQSEQKQMSRQSEIYVSSCHGRYFYRSRWRCLHMSIHMYIHTSRVFMSRYIVVDRECLRHGTLLKNYLSSCHGRHFYRSRWKRLYVSIESGYVTADSRSKSKCHGS